MKTNHLTAKRRYPALLLFVPTLVLMAAGCNGSYGGGGGGGNTPYISGLSVASGPVGTPVTITGTSFGATQGSSTVTFNGTLATPTSWSATSIVVPVPAGATSGSVVVTVGGKASNGMTFTVIPAAPASITATAGTPQSAAVNTAFATQLQATVKDSGNNPVSGVTVTFTAPANGASGTFVGGMNTATTNTQGVATAAVFTANGTAGSYTVTASVPSVPTPANFSLTNLASSAPTITNLTPTSGPVGTPVTITGANFGASQGTSTVAFNGTAATPTSWSAMSIVAPVPTGATSGNVGVTVSGVASNGVNFTVTSSGAPQFPIKVSANKRYFVDQSGTPWLMVMDAAHHLMPVIGSTPSSIATYINSRVALGFNAINLYGACAGTGTCPTSGAAQNGQLPFLIGTQNTNYDLCGSPTPPCTSPNPAYWSQVDAVITAAQNAGLVVLFDPLPWGVNFGTAMENITGPVNYPTNDFNFGVYLGNRYKNFSNIIWQFGQDFRHGALPDQNFMDYMAQVIAGVASVDTNHLITAQMNFNASYTQQGYQVACNASCTSAFWNPRFGNAMNVNFVYSYFETYDEVLQAYNCGPNGTCTIQASNGTNSIGGSSGNAPSNQLPPVTMPLFLGEANYENANNTGALSSNANAFITRLQNWYTMTSGGAGFEFGNAHISHFDSSPLWSTQLNSTATLQVAFLANLFKQFNWWTFFPDQTHQVVTAGFGTYNTGNENLYNATYATTTWDGSTTAIIYTPVSTTLTVNMTKFSGPVTARWYDPTTGNFTTIPGSPFVNSGSQNFAAPLGTHSDGTGANDWVLVLN